MRVLVLGGTQFVGRAIVDALLAGGHDVTLTNRGLSEPTAGSIWGDAVAFIAADRLAPAGTV
jgi:nucleoside-diphosphate-sugar epimerase